MPRRSGEFLPFAVNAAKEASSTRAYSGNIADLSVSLERIADLSVSMQRSHPRAVFSGVSEPLDRVAWEKKILRLC